MHSRRRIPSTISSTCRSAISRTISYTNSYVVSNNSSATTTGTRPTGHCLACLLPGRPCSPVAEGCLPIPCCLGNHKAVAVPRAGCIIAT